MASDQQPVELILARGLMSNLTTPAFLVDLHGTLVFVNDAAGELLGLSHDGAGPMGPLAVALRENRPVHVRFSVRSVRGGEREIEGSAFPIVGHAGRQGAMAIYWDA